MPEFTASTCVPRIAAIERPFGRVVGDPGDSGGQMAVLRAVIQAVEDIATPGEILHLPFEWTDKIDTDADVAPPPITNYLMKHIRQVFKFINREIPQEFRVEDE